MKKTLTIFLLLLSVLFFSQIKFEEGYYITNDNLKKNVLIKNMEWQDYPEIFIYKENTEGQTKQAVISNVQEFYVDNTKYVRYQLEVDDSSLNLNTMSSNSEPIWIKKTVFLKLLVDGKTQLYKYSQNGNVKYFIKKEGRENVEQLIFKKYLSEEQNQSVVRSNNSYKKQLKSINPTISSENLKYEEKSLMKWFNQNSGVKVEENISNEKSKFNMRAKIGFLSSRLKFKSTSELFQDISMKPKTTISPSIELEYVLAFNRNKWSVFCEPTYLNYSSEIATESAIYFTFVNKRAYKVDYTSIVLPLGIKHYMYVSEKSKFFLSGAFVVGIPLNYKIEVSTQDNHVATYEDNPKSTAAGFQLGLGFVYNNKWSLEGKLINQNSGVSVVTSAAKNSVGLSFGYNIF